MQPCPSSPNHSGTLGRSIADGKSTAAERKTRALRLARDLDLYRMALHGKASGRGSSRGSSRCTTWPQLLGPVWERETDADAQAAIGKALEVTHKALHERLKPDETAEGRAFAAARKKSPAANINAQSIVIHSLHRPGAPGIDAATRSSRGRLTPTRRPRIPLTLRRVENEQTSLDQTRPGS